MKLQTSHLELGQELKFWTHGRVQRVAILLQSTKLKSFEI